MFSKLFRKKDPKPSLSKMEQELVVELGYEPSVLACVRSNGESFERLEGLTPEFDSYLANGIVLLTKQKKGLAVLGKTRECLRGTNYSAYLHVNAHGYRPDKIAVVNSRDEYEFLAIVRTSGVNHDLEHDDVIARYRKWDQRYNLSLTGAGQDWLEATFGVAPDDWLVFAQEVYEFCPDVVDQGAGDLVSLSEEMRRRNVVYLWWD